jgi:hypothetical protein
LGGTLNNCIVTSNSAFYAGGASSDSDAFLSAAGVAVSGD